MSHRSLVVRVLAPSFVCLAVAACAFSPEEGGGTPSDDIGVSGEGLTVCAKGSTTKGIDVSHYQGTINWTKVYGGGYRFAIMKASEGTGYTDPTFKTNWAAAKKAGLLRGAYHFFRPSVDGVAQAKHFVSVMGTLADTDLPPVCDLEVQDGVSDATVIQRTKDFMAKVKSLTGRTPMLYSGYFFTSLGSPSGFSQYPLWVAHWTTSCPNIPNGGWKTWTFWQHSDNSSVPGISGNVDGDKYNGSLADLKAWLAPPDKAATGSFDDATCSTLSGWAWDPDTPNQALSVSIYDGDNKTGTLVKKLAAGDKRSDLCTKLGSCNHGFTTPLPPKYQDGTKHTLHAYTTGNAGGAVQLSSSPKSVTCDPPSTGGAGGAGGAAGEAGAAGADPGGAAGSDPGGAAGADPTGSGGSSGHAASAMDDSGDNGGCTVAPGGRNGDRGLALGTLLLGALIAFRRRRLAQGALAGARRAVTIEPPC
jgi:GH25 family lysozyme M1 (1,4-beta-N-acetylmuramidase)